MALVKNLQTHDTKPLVTNQQTTIQVPVYGTIQSLVLRFTESSGAPAAVADIRSEITNIRLTFNGREVVNVTPARLFDFYAHLANHVAVPAGNVGNLELCIGRLLYDTPEVRDAFGWGTENIQTIQVQITSGTLVNVANAQVISARTAEQRVLGSHFRFIDFPQSFNATGDHTVDTLPRDPDSAYALVMTDDGTAGTITFGECKVNNNTVFDRIPRDTITQFLSNNRYAHTAGYYIYSFSDGAGGTLLPMSGVTDLRFKTTFSVAPGAGGYTMAALTLNGIVAQR